MIWFYFTVGIALGAMTTVIASLIFAFKEYIAHQQDMAEKYNQGFDDGREWKEAEKEWAGQTLQDLQEEIEELKKKKCGKK